MYRLFPLVGNEDLSSKAQFQAAHCLPCLHPRGFWKANIKVGCFTMGQAGQPGISTKVLFAKKRAYTAPLLTKSRIPFLFGRLTAGPKTTSWNPSDALAGAHPSEMSFVEASLNPISILASLLGCTWEGATFFAVIWSQQVQQNLSQCFYLYITKGRKAPCFTFTASVLICQGRTHVLCWWRLLAQADIPLTPISC